MVDYEKNGEAITVTSLKLAAWLRLHGHIVQKREVQSDGRLQYSFEINPRTMDLIGEWQARSSEIQLFDRFATIVSKEIRFAVRQRREAGIMLVRRPI